MEVMLVSDVTVPLKPKLDPKRMDSGYVMSDSKNVSPVANTGKTGDRLHSEKSNSQQSMVRNRLLFFIEVLLGYVIVIHVDFHIKHRISL